MDYVFGIQKLHQMHVNLDLVQIQIKQQVMLHVQIIYQVVLLIQQKLDVFKDLQNVLNLHIKLIVYQI
jgi:hypothetical protein